jgi:hypothetical protein
MIGDLEGAALPELAGEFTETLCYFWRKHRSDYTTDTVPMAMLYVLLDSLTSVVLESEDE